MADEANRQPKETRGYSDNVTEDTSERYHFGVAIFNAQEFDHSYSVCVQWLELE